jgi:type II secretory pathway component PulK
MAGRCEQKERKPQGSILIVTLWSLCFLTVLMVYLGMGVRQKIQLAYHLDARDSLRCMAEAGVKRALITFNDVDPTPAYDVLREQWSNDPSSFKHIEVGPGYFTVGYQYLENSIVKSRYGLRDEESKINLNTADVKVISRLFVHIVGLGANEANKLAYAVIDWRDADSFYQHPQYGAEDSDYRSLREPYECKDAVFEVPEELLLVKGMTNEMFDMVKPYVTIYGEGKVNINTVSSEVLLALGLNGSIVDTIIRYRNGDDETEGTDDDNIFKSATAIVPQLSQFYHLGPSEVAQLSNLVSAGTLEVRSDHFMAISSAELKRSSKQKAAIVAVFDREGQITYWREHYF